MWSVAIGTVVAVVVPSKAVVEVVVIVVEVVLVVSEVDVVDEVVVSSEAAFPAPSSSLQEASRSTVITIIAALRMSPTLRPGAHAPGSGVQAGTLARRDPTGARPLIEEVRANRRRARALVLGASAPVLVVAALVGLLLGGVAVAAVLAVVVTGAWAAWLWRAGAGVARRTLDGRPADPVEHARLQNLVEGLCSSAGVPVPEVLVVDDPAPNAAVYGLEPRTATLVVTSGLLERLGRLELEAVLARELAAVRSLDIRPATVAVGLLRVAGGIGPLTARIRTTASTPAVVADASGVALTRYPPGLASALGKLAPDGAGVRATSGATGHLWLVPSAGGPDVHPPLEERIQALREL